MNQSFDFMGLPREVRDVVYSHAADWKSTSRNRSLETPTPTILLLNKQIHKEAREALRKLPLTLTTNDILPQISTETFLNMRYLFIEADEHKDIGGDDARDLSAKDLAFCLTFQGPWIRQSDRLESIRYRVGETVFGGQTEKADVGISTHTLAQP